MLATSTVILDVSELFSIKISIVSPVTRDMIAKLVICPPAEAVTLPRVLRSTVPFFAK